jgi:hypothetical protein
MTIKQLKEILSTIKDDSVNIMVASDEEWNTVFKDIHIEKYSPLNTYVLFGASGSEQEL